jgi:hypothetical protein
LYALAGDLDGSSRLLDICGVSHRSASEWRAAFDDAGIVFIGCRRGLADMSAIDVRRFLRRGGTIISSDLAATAPGLRSLCRPLGCAGPVRARVGVTDPASGQTTPAPLPIRDVPEHLQFYPAINLSPGHPRLAVSAEQLSTTRVLARDVLSGDPLVVLVREGNGWLLHAAPHWWQSGGPLNSALGRRLLGSVPGLRRLGPAHAHVSFGEFLSAWTMLWLLFSGLSVVLGCAGPAARCSAGHFHADDE